MIVLEATYRFLVLYLNFFKKYSQAGNLTKGNTEFPEGATSINHFIDTSDTTSLFLPLYCDIALRVYQSLSNFLEKVLNLPFGL